MELEEVEGSQPGAPGTDADGDADGDAQAASEQGWAEDLARKLLDKFEQDWAPAVENLGIAEQASAGKTGP